MRSQRGVSLIELMVSIAIGALLLLGLIQVFQATNVSAQLGTALSRVQENGRFALEFMRSDVRMAGHMGCTSGGALVRDYDVAPLQLQSAMRIAGQNVSFMRTPPTGTVAPPFVYDFRYDIQGFEANNTNSNTGAPTAATLTIPPAVGGAGDWTPALPAELLALTPPPIRGSDIVVVRYGLPGEMNLTGGFTTGGASPVIAVSNGVIADSGLTFQGVSQTGVPFVATSCTGNTQGLVFIGDTLAPNPPVGPTLTVSGGATNNYVVIAAEGLSATSEGGSTLTRLDFVAYYVGLNPNNLPALYRASLSGAANAAGLVGLGTEEIVEGVETLQISYGFELDPPIPPPPAGTAPPPARTATAADLNSRVDAYATAAQLQGGTGPVGPLNARNRVEVWRRVISVRIGVLTRSASRISGEGTAAMGPYDVNGVRFSLSQQDSLLRESYEEVITIRNRLRNLNTGAPPAAGP